MRQKEKGKLMAARSTQVDWSIISLPEFIQATRDSGYKGTANALAELVDNSLQAGASSIDVFITPTGNDASPLSIAVRDDGCGMSRTVLRQALRFGGSTRFDNRSGLGRYGMGLPNASLSQARCVTVFTWAPAKSRRREIVSTFIDLDRIAAGEMREVPSPRRASDPPHDCRGKTGTLVVWSRCDRLDLRRPDALERRLTPLLGRKFRHFIWRGVSIRINGTPVTPIDPLGVHENSPLTGATQFGEPLVYDIKVPGAGAVGKVVVRFSELPIAQLFDLPNDEKRRLGIANGAGVSIVRAGREVDFGWFLMGSKRRENYDDWWRCEVQFEPMLDEAFGISHTKQQVRPSQLLVEAIGDDMEEIARALNARARKGHLAAKSKQQFSHAEHLAASRDHLLPPLPSRPSKAASAMMREVERQLPELKHGKGKSKYRIAELSLREASFFSYARDSSQLVLLLNPDHPFHAKVYRPLSESDGTESAELRVKVELLLLSAARAEAARAQSSGGGFAAEFRSAWSRALAAFLDG